MPTSALHAGLQSKVVGADCVPCGYAHIDPSCRLAE